MRRRCLTRRSRRNHEPPPRRVTRHRRRHGLSHHIRVVARPAPPDDIKIRTPSCRAHRSTTHLPAASNGDRRRHGRAPRRRRRGRGRRAVLARGWMDGGGGGGGERGPGRAAALLPRVLRPVRAARRVLVLPALLLPPVRRCRLPGVRPGIPRPASGLRAVVRALPVRPAPAGEQGDGRVPGHLPQELRGGGVQGGRCDRRTFLRIRHDLDETNLDDDPFM